MFVRAGRLLLWSRLNLRFWLWFRLRSRLYLRFFSLWLRSR